MLYVIAALLVILIVPWLRGLFVLLFTLTTAGAVMALLVALGLSVAVGAIWGLCHLFGAGMVLDTALVALVLYQIIKAIRTRTWPVH